MDAVIFWVLLLGLYFLPSVVASLRHHHNEFAIFVLNLLLGWTALGWIIALVWSLTNSAKEKTAHGS